MILHCMCDSCCCPGNYSIVMVVGAGRGPLVKATLQAASKTERLVRVYAVEKNPGAIVT